MKTDSENPVLNTSIPKTGNNIDNIRLTITLTSFEHRCLEALIQHHYNETGVILSKNAYIRSVLVPSLRDARDYLVPDEEH